MTIMIDSNAIPNLLEIAATSGMRMVHDVATVADGGGIEAPCEDGGSGISACADGNGAACADGEQAPSTCEDGINQLHSDLADGRGLMFAACGDAIK